MGCSVVPANIEYGFIFEKSSEVWGAYCRVNELLTLESNWRYLVSKNVNLIVEK